MENTDIDMVISIPDTPDRAVRRTREVKRRPRSPEAPARYQSEEYRNYLKGRTRPVPEVGENRESFDTRTENGHRSRSSGSNALFRRTGVEKDRGKSICTDPCVAPVERNSVVSNGHAHVTSSRGLPSIEIRELRSSNDCSPLRGDHNSFKLPGIIGNKGKEKADGGSASNRETIDLSSDKKPSRGTKRLVRHGCISPNEIAARAKQVVDTSSKDTVSVEPEIAPETASSIGIREIVSGNEVHGRARGKRPEIPYSRMSSRDAVGSESERWISTRNRKSNIGHELNHRDDETDTQEICSSVSRIDVHETVGEVERENRQQRRRKNGFTTARALNEADYSVIRASGEPSNSRPSRTHNHQRQGIQQVLEIEDSSPDEWVVRRPRRIGNNESGINGRQIEADEMLARELQEQLYQESALNTNEHMDENIARLLAQEENSLRASSSSSSTSNTQGPNNIAVPGLRSRMEARQQGDTRRRRINTLQGRLPVRAPPRGRGQRLGRDSASLHRSLNLSFPNDMGLDSRLNFLEELENVFGHTVNNSNLLHMDRDFTEDDYELLLALDDNNHRHGGASTHRINNLPESTVQNDNFQETCVICLETPTIGDTIRHLPCLHKFHKDCIDPWLGRSKACPVCKSSVT